MSANKKYIGLTIGPIYKTLGQARKTIELWAASYTFSYLMKRIVGSTLAMTNSDPSFQVKMLNPLADASKGDGTPAGYYPDRLILESNGEKDFEKMKELVRVEVEALAHRMAGTLTNDNQKKDYITEVITNYFQVYLVYLPSSVGHPLLTTNEYLETAELQPTYKPQDPEAEDYVIRFFQKLKKQRGLIKKVYEGVRIPIIESLEEIAVQELKGSTNWSKIEQKAEMDIEKNYINAAKDILGKETLKRISYVAIVHADGDSVGKTISSLSGAPEFQDYCKRLMAFQEMAVAKINDFGGLPIYAGGDDLLFFAPIYNGGKNIFQLLEDLNKDFHEEIKDLVEQQNAKNEERDEPIPTPTLSFGLSITYYKFPLYEALEQSRNLLFDKAKNFSLTNAPDGTKRNKNAVAVKLLLHSGNYFENVFSLRKKNKNEYEDPTYGFFKTMLESNAEDKDLRLNSINYALDRNETLFSLIRNDEIRLK
jgi:CRISPR-associated protein Cmr2